MASHGIFGYNITMKKAYLRHLIAIVIIQLVVIAIAYFANRYLPPQIPLYYGQPEGPEQLANYSHVFIVPLSIIASSLLAFFLLRYLKDGFLHRVILGTLYTITFIEIITFIKIFLLIT